MKKIFSFFIILTMCFIIIGGSSETYAYSLTSEISISSVSPKADIIEWRYKIEDGKTYKRLYNYTQKVWVGNWILIG